MNHEPSPSAGFGASTRAPSTAGLAEHPSPRPQKAHHGPSDPFLNSWRTARSEAAQRLLRGLYRSIADHEETNAPRAKARRHDDALRWEEMVEAVICALALQTLRPCRSGQLALPLSHKQNLAARYRRPTQGEPLTRLLDYLDALGLAKVLKGQQQGLATTIAPSPRFSAAVWASGVAATDFGWRRDREVIVLRRSTGKGAKRTKQWVAYEDTPETERLRAEVAGFNAPLADADLRYVGNDAQVDTTDRQLRRHFTVLKGQEVRFDQGGRFFGGFWQRTRKEDRKHFRINGEHVAEVDYSAAFTHIAFAQLGIEPPGVQDLYRIPGLERLGRKQIKSAINAFYFDTWKGRSEWPEDFVALEWADPDTGEVFEGFPDEFTPAKVREAIVGHYPALGKVFGTGIGYQLMFLESQIMCRLLSKAHQMGLTVLPLHDALVVPRSAGPLVASLMKEVSMEVTGLCIPVTLKHH